ncbi:MAG TPA: metalloregulator ArsR/SmtB family transcription factor [Phycisphaerales bacterium]|nr:metalloregulator ArsR/SmtB family transcription factor [Phycisphaerales bacterium]
MKQLTGDRLAERLGSLSEPVRLRLLAMLEAEELSVGEVARVLQLPQSTVSRHLKVLADAGWTSKRALGTATLYRLDAEGLDPEAAALWAPVRESLAGLPDVEEDRTRLAAVLAERPTDSLAFFGRIAGEWDELRRDLFGGRFTAEALLSLIPPTWVVADLGCGTGDAAAWLGARVERVVAVDRSDAMLDAARKRLGGAPNVEFLAGELELLPIERASVDATVSLLVLHHVASPEAALGEMARVLRTSRGGGVALVVDMLGHSRTEYRLTMGHKHLGFDPNAVGAWMRRAGFHTVRITELAREPEGKGPGLFAAAGWKAPT